MSCSIDPAARVGPYIATARVTCRFLLKRRRQEAKGITAKAASAVAVAEPASQEAAEVHPGASSSDLVQSDAGWQPKVRPRPYKRQGHTVSKTTPSGTAHITMNEDEERHPFEVFLEIGKAGSDIKAMAEAMED